MDFLTVEMSRPGTATDPALFTVCVVLFESVAMVLARDVRPVLVAREFLRRKRTIAEAQRAITLAQAHGAYTHAALVHPN